jgi:hypothetical protein
MYHQKVISEKTNQRLIISILRGLYMLPVSRPSSSTLTVFVVLMWRSLGQKRSPEVRYVLTRGFFYHLLRSTLG